MKLTVYDKFRGEIVKETVYAPEVISQLLRTLFLSRKHQNIYDIRHIEAGDSLKIIITSPDMVFTYIGIPAYASCIDKDEIQKEIERDTIKEIYS